MYKYFFKRLFDIIISFLCLILLTPLFLIITFLIYVKLGRPAVFRQLRPGYKEKLFFLLKFRTMSDERDENGRLLPDSMRLTKFGKALRATSLDEIPELINIRKGDMSFVGPRPLLVRDMVFMTVEQRKRHDVYPGLTGLAQVKGRNLLSWENKLNLDLKYIEKISFINDIRIILETIIKVLKQEGISEEGMDTAQDLGDYLLRTSKIDLPNYYELMKTAEEVIYQNGKKST